MVVTEEKIREGFVAAPPFSPTEEGKVEVCHEAWAESEFERILDRKSVV